MHTLREFLAVAAVLMAATAGSQEKRAGAPPQTGGPTFRARTELVTIPAVVTRGGRHVSGMKKEDFSILEDGQPRTIAFFEEIHTKPQVIEQAQTPGGTYTNEITETREPAGLTIILLDTLHTPYLFQANARKEIIKFLSNSITAGQPTMLLQLTRKGIQVIHNFTTSPDVLMAALRNVRSTLEGNKPQQAELTDADHMPQSAQARNEIELLGAFAASDPYLSSVEAFACDDARMTLDELRQLARSLGAVAGRKTMVLASGGTVFFPMELPQVCPDLASNFNETWALLSSANIAVYPVDVAQPENPTYASPEYKAPVRTGRPIAKQMLFDSVASSTGGTVCSFRNDLDTCFKKAVEDSSEYYMLSYYAKPLEKPGWRKLVVKTHLQGVHVRARSGYFSLGVNHDPEAQRKMDVALAIVSPVEYTGLPFSVRWDKVTGPPEKPKYGFELRISPKALTVDQQDGNHLKMNVVVVAQDAAGKTVGSLTQEIEAKLKPESLQKLLSSGMRYSNALEAPAGDSKVKFILRDALTGRMGTVTAPMAKESPAATEDSANASIPAPTALPKRLHLRAEMQSTINAAKARAGDEVRMQVLVAERDNNDAVIIPKGAKLFGRVVEVSARTVAAPESRIGILIERAEWKDRSVPLHAFIVAQGQVRFQVDCNSGAYSELHPCFSSSTSESDQASPALEKNIELRLIGTPPTASLLVSRKRNVVLRKGMMFVIRNTP